MVLPFLPPGKRSASHTDASTSRIPKVRRAWKACALVAILAVPAASPCAAQVITIDTSGKGPVAVSANAPVDRRYAQITPTSVPLPKSELDAKTRLELIRALQAEQGFAMRPFPRGHRGLTLVANGKLEPAGEAYLNMVIASGTSSKPGDRLVITDVKIENNKIVFLLNGGPDPKHQFLRHISIGTNPSSDRPVVADDGQEPVGSRLTLDFGSRIPELTGAQVKALRTHRGLTQAQLAEAAEMTPDEVSRIERGTREPRFATIERLAAALDAPPRKLFDGATGWEATGSRPRRRSGPAGPGLRRVAERCVRLLQAALEDK